MKNPTVDVKITGASEIVLRAYQLPIAKEVIQSLKNDDGKVNVYPYIRQAANSISGHYVCDIEILQPDAHITTNFRVDNRYLSNSGEIDVLLTFLLRDEEKDLYRDVICYLSDVFDLDGSDEARERLIKRSCIKNYLLSGARN